MKKKKWRIFKILLILMLCMSTLINTQSSHALFATNTDVSEKKENTDINQMNLESNQEDTTHDESNVFDEKLFSENNKASAVILLNENGWSETVSYFNLIASIAVPDSLKGNKLTLHLPQYIKLDESIQPGGDLVGADVSGSSNSVDGTTIVLTFKDPIEGTINETITMGKYIRISQQDFIEKSFTNTYRITATYNNASGDTVTNSKDFQPSINADKEITNKLQIFLPEKTTASHYIIPVHDYKYTVQFVTGFALDSENSQGVIKISSETMKYFNWIGEASFIQSDGTVHIPIDTNMYTAGEKTIRFDLPIQMKDDMRFELLFKSQPNMIHFEIDLQLKNNKQSHISNEFNVAYFTRGGDLNNQGIAFMDLISNEYKAFYPVQYTLAVDGKSGIFTSDEDDLFYNKVIEFLQKFDVTFELKLPNQLDWSGESTYYDVTTRTLRLSISQNNNGFEVRQFRSSGGNGFSFGIILQTLALKYQYAYDSGNNITPTEIQFPETKLYYKSTQSADYKLLDTILNAKSQVRQTDVPISLAYVSDIFDETQNALLLNYRLSQKSIAYENFYPKFDYSIDFNQKNNNEFSLNDVFDVKEIRMTPTKDKNGKYIPMIIKVTTNKKTTEYTADSAGFKVELLPDEQISSLSIQPKTDKYAPIYEGTVYVYGDVNVKNKSKYFEKSDSVLYSVQASTSRWLTEQEGSYFGQEKKSSTVSRNIKKFKKASLNSTEHVGDFYPGTSSTVDFSFQSPSSEYGVDEVTYQLDSEFLSQSYLKIKSISGKYASAKFSLSYTTNFNETLQTFNDVNAVHLEPNEYFTSMTLVIKKSYVTLKIGFQMPLITSPKEVVNIDKIKLFKIDETDKIETSYYYATQIKLHPDIPVNISSISFYKGSTSWTSGELNLGNINPNDEKIIPLQIQIEQSTASPSVFQVPETIYNPTFYIEILDAFDYSSLVLSGSMNGKKPYTTIIQLENGKRMLKVKFYGDPNQETGYEDILKPGDLSMKVKVREFAKAGEIKKKASSVYVDLAEWYKKLSKENPLIRLSHGNRNTSDDTFYDSDSNETKKLSYSLYSDYRSYLSYNVLQNTSIKAGASVSSDKVITQSDQLIVRSGEEFNAFVDLYNNAGGSLSDFTMYIPIPREGKDDGLGEKWKWSAELITAGLDTSGTVNVSYSTQPHPTMNQLTGGADPSGMYYGSVSDLSKVTMVKLSANEIGNGTLVSLKARIKNLDDKTVSGDQKITVRGLYSYKFSGSETYNQSSTKNVTVTLSDTSLKGILFIDMNENGILDDGETRLSNKMVTLYDKNDQQIESVNSNVNGEYSFSKAALNEGDYLEVEKIDGHVLTWHQKENMDKKITSYFSRDTYRAVPNLQNAEYLNAGFIETPEIIPHPAEYTVRMIKNDTIQYTLSDKSTKDIQFQSLDESVATVNENGVITPVSVGTTTIKLYYLTTSGIEISTTVKVKIESNDAAVITAPEVITMNVGDLWNPKDTSIIDGLAITDDHDEVNIDSLTIEDNVPVGEKFLFFFSTSHTDRIQKAGTYSLKYSYQDKDNNRSEKIVKVKVNSQPILEDLDGKELTEDNMPYFYFRVGESLNPLKDVKAFYYEASDHIGDPAVKKEISPTDTTNGIFTLKNPIDSEGNPVTGSPDHAGKYQGSYYIKTASQAKSEAVLEVNRVLYAQGKIEFTGHNIAYPSSSDKHYFDSWIEFYNQYRDKLNISAKLLTPEENGQVVSKDILDTLQVIDPITGQERLFHTIDFSLPSGTTTREIILTLRVYDDGKAQWNESGNSVYGETYKDISITVTVQNYVGEPPQIQLTNIERVTTDEVRDTTLSEKNLISDEAMKEAAEKNTHPLYDRLMNDVTFSDDKEIVDKKIVSIKRSSYKPKSSQKAEYDPNIEKDIKEMLTTIGTYKIMYQTKDNDNNQISAERIVYVSGPTVFVKDMTNKETPEDTIKMKVNNNSYTPSPLYAYHIDYDEVTYHEVTVLVDQLQVDIHDPGTYEVTYSTEHHFKTYPDGQTKRPLDTFKVKLMVNGDIHFNYPNNHLLANQWINKQVDLSGVTATYEKAQNTVGAAPVSTHVPITNHLSNTKTVTSSTPDELTVHLSANASIDSGVENHQSSIDTRIRFYGLPYIRVDNMTLNAAHEINIDIKEGMSLTEMKNLHSFYLEYQSYDGTVVSQKLEPTLEKISDKQYKVYASDNVIPADGMQKADEDAYAAVYMNVIEKPVIKTSKDVYEVNVGDTFDIKTDTGLQIEYKDAININDIKITYGDTMGELPLTDGKLTKTGSYLVKLSYEDYVGNIAEKEILVKVNGKPKISGIDDIEKRVGDSFNVWKDVSVTYLKAPDFEGVAVEESFDYTNATDKGAMLILKDMQNELNGQAVDFKSLNTPGSYSGIYYAKTPTGAEVSQKRKLLLHGQPKIEANNIIISKNVEDPGDFLEAYKDKLGIYSEVIRAYADKPTEKIDISDRVLIDVDKSEEIKYGTEGIYKVVLSVTDDMTVMNSTNNTVYKEMTVTIASIINPEDLPDIKAPTRERVVEDPIGRNNNGNDQIAEYLNNQLDVTIKNGNTVKRKLLSAKKVKGPSTNKLENINIEDNNALKEMLNTVGIYDVEIELTDKHQNKIITVQKWKVAGKTEFGFGEEDKNFQVLNDNADINVRQSDTQYTLSRLRARHQDPDGNYHYMGINEAAKTYDIQSVKKYDIKVSSIHHYGVYENDELLPRDEDQITFHLLVQGTITFHNVDQDIYTRVGTSVNPLKQINDQGNTVDVYATFQKIDNKGNIIVETLNPFATAFTPSSVGERSVVITATDNISGANNNTATVLRKVIVASVPIITYNEQFNVNKEAKLTDLMNGLASEIKYIDSKNQEKLIDGGAVTISYPETLKKIQDNKAGMKHPLTIHVKYSDNGEEKEISKTAYVYVLNSPETIVQIPAYLELKDDGDNQVSTQAEVSLYPGDDKDSDKGSVPAISVHVDPEINLVNGSEQVKAYTYKNDGFTRYDGVAPITQLKYGVLDKYLFYLKANRKDITTEGLYQGVLNFTMGYEGE